MSSKEKLKNLENKELSDEELNKVAGGKDLGEGDITSGSLFHYWENDESICFWLIISCNGETANYSEFTFKKKDPSKYTESYGYSVPVSNIVSSLNSQGAYKVDRLPEGYAIYE